MLRLFDALEKGAKTSRIHTLDLSGSYLGDEAGRRLSSLLRAGVLPQLKALVLSREWPVGRLWYKLEAHKASVCRIVHTPTT
jgi:Ran GTPase-activating protein (RanGAP) involved in mRNA processing and transport